MRQLISTIILISLLGLSAFSYAEPAVIAVEEATAIAAPAAAATPAPVVDKGDMAWMIVATVLVILMVVPGLALFYGGMVRAKNMLSILMQVFVIFSLTSILWAV